MIFKPRAASSRPRTMPGRDTMHFLKEWARDPRGVAAVAPSGRALATLITREIGPRTGAVLELGPGTGIFTQALLSRGLSQDQLTLIEFSERFAQLLRARFPRAHVLHRDASALGEEVLAGEPFGAAVCGLGLLNMDARTVRAIVTGAFDRMRPDAALFLFTYGRRCSIPRPVLDELGLSAARVGTTLLNLPPATVFRVTRRT